MQARRSSLYRKVVAGAPTLLVRDTFTDSDNTLLVNHTPDIDTVGGGWTEVQTAARMDISSANQMAQSGSPSGITVVAIDTGVTDCVITAGLLTFRNIASGTRTMGLAGRVVDGNNLIVGSIWTLSTNPWTWGLWDFQGGAVVASSTGQGVSGGNSTSIFPLNAKLTLNGTSARFEIPSENIDLSITTTSPGTKTKHGIRAYGGTTSVSAGYVDDFEITTL